MIPHPYERLLKYPGMRPHDQVIWEQFILNHPNAFHTVYYDVHLGNPADDPDKEMEMRANGGWDVSQWCVDVIGVADNYTAVIEVKPGARAGALGQAIAYRALLADEGLIKGNTVPMVLTDELLPVTMRAAQLLGVHLLVP